MDVPPTTPSPVQSPREVESPRELHLIISNVERGMIMRYDMLVQRLELELKARELQAKEYERRLEALNHAHENARDKERDFVPRDYYDSAHREIEKKVETNSSTLIALMPLVGRMDALAVWREEVIRIVGNYQAIPVEIGSLNTKVNSQEGRISDLDKRLTSVYSYGAGAMGVLIVVSILINIAVRFIFKS